MDSGSQSETHPNSQLNHTVNSQSGLGRSRVVREKTSYQIMKGKPQDFMWWQSLHLHLIV